MIQLLISVSASLFLFFTAFYIAYVIDGFKNGLFNIDKLNILGAHEFILGIITVIVFNAGGVNLLFKLIVATLTFTLPTMTELLVKKLFKPLNSL